LERYGVVGAPGLPVGLGEVGSSADSLAVFASEAAFAVGEDLFFDGD
jgi:hypothetical protein